MNEEITTGGPSQKDRHNGFRPIVDNMWLFFIDLIFPRRCVGCRQIGSLLCFKCKARLEFLLEQRCAVCGDPAQGGFTHSYCLRKGSPERLFSALRYKDPLRQALFHWKYRDTAVVMELFDSLLQETCERFEVYFPSDFVFVPVPLHPKRLQERGFNQALALARSLADTAQRQYREDLLVRTRFTDKQMEIKDDKERKSNVVGAFALVPGKEGEVSGHNFVLVDDVWTTGATCLAALDVLKKAGAKNVWIFTLARGR